MGILTAELGAVAGGTEVALTHGSDEALAPVSSPLLDAARRKIAAIQQSDVRVSAKVGASAEPELARTADVVRDAMYRRPAQQPVAGSLSLDKALLSSAMEVSTSAASERTLDIIAGKGVVPVTSEPSTSRTIVTTPPMSTPSAVAPLEPAVPAPSGPTCPDGSRPWARDTVTGGWRCAGGLVIDSSGRPMSASGAPGGGGEEVLPGTPATSNRGKVVAGALALLVVGSLAYLVIR